MSITRDELRSRPLSQESFAQRHPFKVANPQSHLRKIIPPLQKVSNMEFVVEEPVMFNPGLTQTEGTKDAEDPKIPPMVVSTAKT